MEMENVNIKTLLKQYLPSPIQHKILDVRESIRRTVNSQRYRGNKHYCPICGTEISEYLVNNGIALCPICDSSERHRVDWLFFNRHTDLFDEKPKNLLHVAPELFLTKRFSEIQDIEYVSVDIDKTF
jgi:RNA polymerase subunit RPABC4/transcription elongation factor Spt4